MLYSDDFIFLHLQKTGGNHVAKLLSRHYQLTKNGKHNGIADGFERPHVLFGIRNPWDWYVSLWAYGCQDEGSIWSYLTSERTASITEIIGRHGARPATWGLAASHLAAIPGKSADVWREFYQDADDPVAFRGWLKYLHSRPGSRHTGEDFSALPLSDSCGLMTARYLEVGSRAADWSQHRAEICSVEDAAAYRAQYLAATHFIRTESLEADVADALAALGISETAESLLVGRTNSSNHKSADFYYDDASIALVAQRDRAVIEAHGYTFPE